MGGLAGGVEGVVVVVVCLDWTAAGGAATASGGVGVQAAC